jgi:hypothetical protein
MADAKSPASISHIVTRDVDAVKYGPLMRQN